MLPKTRLHPVFLARAEEVELAEKKESSMVNTRLIASQMLRDTSIIILSCANILIYGFLALNYQAVQNVFRYQLGQTINNPIQTAEDMSSWTTSIKKTLRSQQSGNTFWEGSLIIPKIQLNTPVQHPAGNDPQQFQNALNQGAVSLSKSTDSHDQNPLLIFGHSSDYSWNNNPYGSIFALLPQLKPGDQIQLSQANTRTFYKVESSLISSPDLKELMQNPPDSQDLILSTCYPIGFYSQRYNVIAKPVESLLETQISP